MIDPSRKPDPPNRHLRLVEVSTPPRTRADCEKGPRPCPWLACRYNLAPDAKRADHESRQFETRRSAGVTDTCALDVADRGEHTLEEVGELLGMTKERARQIEERGLAKFRRLMTKAKLEGKL